MGDIIWYCAILDVIPKMYRHFTIYRLSNKTTLKGDIGMAYRRFVTIYRLSNKTTLKCDIGMAYRRFANNKKGDHK